MISIETLIGQIQTSCPYILDPVQSQAPYSVILQNALAKMTSNKLQGIVNGQWRLDEYFSVCMAAHWASAGSFCPTDVDNLIRFHVWQFPEIGEFAEKMWQLTYDALFWDYQEATKKIVIHENPRFNISTHEGTWFSVAVGAYDCALRLNNSLWAEKLLELILWELAREEEVAHFWFKNDPLTFIYSIPLVTHNLGDYDRVIELGNVNKDNILAKKYFKLGDRANTIFQLSSQFYKENLASDGHRYFALRNPKFLRKSASLLLPISPFLENWGENLIKSKMLNDEEKALVAYELADGFRKLPGDTWGFPRAFHGILNALGSMKKIEDYLPRSKAKLLYSPDFLTKAKVAPAAFRSRYLRQLEKNSKANLANKNLFSFSTLHF